MPRCGSWWVSRVAGTLRVPSATAHGVCLLLVKQFVQVNVVRAELAAVVPRGDLHDPLSARRLDTHASRSLDAREVEAVEHEFVDRVHALGELRLDCTAERRAVRVVRAGLECLVLAAHLAPG